MRRWLKALPGAVLVFENLLLFDRHYVGGYSFPWDFAGTYYAATAYWTTAIAHGRLGMWMPFEAMGYPFPMNLQTGLWYAPFWIFPLLGIPYTLHAAVVVQCLHVLAGAFGMYVLLRALVRSRREALVGAFCFQLFGGFYSNAEHADIVRSFALTPWLLWCLTPPREGEGAMPRRLALLPLFVWAMATGGYPGNLIAALFLLGVFVALVNGRDGLRRRFRWAAGALGGVALGLAMAAIHLGPAWLFRAEIERYHGAATIDRLFLGVAHLPGLILTNRGLPGDFSMASTFVGFVVLAGVCMLSRRSLGRLWPYAIVGVLAAAMAAGDNLPVNGWLRSRIAPLGYSRFPTSDYRCFVAVVLIVLAAFGWRDLRRRRSLSPGLSARFVPLLLFAAWSLDRARLTDVVPSPGGLAALVCLAMAVGGLLYWQNGRKHRTLAAVAVLLVAAGCDGARVLSRMDTWAVPNLFGVDRKYYATPLRLLDAGLVLDPAVLREPKPPRPARQAGQGYRYWAEGYLAGSYEVYDFGGGILRGASEILRDPVYRPYMRREWIPVVVEPSTALVPAGGAIEVRDLRDRIRGAAPDPRVTQTAYGIDRIAYTVRLAEPALLVENETYFPGWSARLSGTGAPEAPVPGLRVNGVLRGWMLPAGEYAMEARFRFPHLFGLAALTAAAWIVWIALLATRLRRARSSP